MRRILAVFALLCCTLFFAQQARSADSELEFGQPLYLGVAPFLSTPALLRLHRPLREYLSRVLGQEVRVVSARNHERFLRGIIDRRYDIIITPAHFLPMAVDKGFVPLVRYRTPLELLLVVRDDSNIHSVADLRGQRIALPDRLSFYYIVGMQWLYSAGFVLDKDCTVVEEHSHMTGLLALDAGKVDVAVTARPPWMQLAPSARGRMRFVDVEHPLMPSLTTLVQFNLGGKEIERIQAALEAFPKSAEGGVFFSSSGYGGYVKATEADVKDARRYEKLVNQLMMSGKLGSEMERDVLGGMQGR